MPKDHYGFDVQKINCLADVSPNKSAHYVYGTTDIDIHFLYKPAHPSKGLLVVFHGARYMKGNNLIPPLPIFRLYDYQADGISVLSIGDPVLQKYDSTKLELSWFLDTCKCNSTKHIVNMISHINKLEESNNILFFGSSSGGFPAAKYACIFKQKALFSNSQLYLEKYHYWQKLNEILKANNDRIVGDTNIVEVIEHCGMPMKIGIYSNMLDVDHHKNHAEPLVEYLHNSGYSNIVEYCAFKCEAPENGSVHHAQWTRPYKDLIEEYLNHSNETCEANLRAQHQLAA